jgi:hypothetical protein
LVSNDHRFNTIQCVKIGLGGLGTTYLPRDQIITSSYLDDVNKLIRSKNSEHKKSLERDCKL